MGEPGAPRAGTQRDKAHPVPQGAGTATWHPWVCGSAGGRGGHKQQSTAQRLKHGRVQNEPKQQRTNHKELMLGELRAGLPPRGGQGKAAVREPSEAPSGKGSPGEGHLPPRRTQDVSRALSRTGHQQGRQCWKGQSDHGPPGLWLDSRKGQHGKNRNSAKRIKTQDEEKLEFPWAAEPGEHQVSVDR